MEAQLIHADMMKVIGTFCNYANVPKTTFSRAILAGLLDFEGGGCQAVHLLAQCNVPENLESQRKTWLNLCENEVR